VMSSDPFNQYSETSTPKFTPPRPGWKWEFRDTTPALRSFSTGGAGGDGGGGGTVSTPEPEQAKDQDGERRFSSPSTGSSRRPTAGLGRVFQKGGVSLATVVALRSRAGQVADLREALPAAGPGRTPCGILMTP
jgi:hypothetical protein